MEDNIDIFLYVHSSMHACSNQKKVPHLSTLTFFGKEIGIATRKMHTKRQTILIIGLMVMLYSCSKRYVPQHDNVPVFTGSNNRPAAKPAPAAASKPAVRTMVKRTAPAAAPKVIWVNDKVAKRNFDGRLYYDLEGRRYWKNYVDGKYYLYHRAMYSDSAFKPRR
jgi:hypothetical protein